VAVAIRKHFTHLSSSKGSVNLAQYAAQRHEEEMTEMLIGFARDISQPAFFRRECALDVLKIARGPIEPWKHDGKTIDQNAIGHTGSTVGTEIEATRLTTALHEAVADLTMRGIPVELWPADVREAAGQLVAAYSETG
jgi:hypothetical protein